MQEPQIFSALFIQSAHKLFFVLISCINQYNNLIKTAIIPLGPNGFHKTFDNFFLQKGFVYREIYIVLRALSCFSAVCLINCSRYLYQFTEKQYIHANMVKFRITFCTAAGLSPHHHPDFCLTETTNSN